jgi:hypothetical protein
MKTREFINIYVLFQNGFINVNDVATTTIQNETK